MKNPILITGKLLISYSKSIKIVLGTIELAILNYLIWITNPSQVPIFYLVDSIIVAIYLYNSSTLKFWINGFNPKFYESTMSLFLDYLFIPAQTIYYFIFFANIVMPITLTIIRLFIGYCQFSYVTQFVSFKKE